MRYRVLHQTRYAYDAAVYLEPHTVRLRPRDGGGQRLLAWSIRVEPEPATITEALDLEGNVLTHAWFEGLTSALRFDVAFDVETTRPNPFDYLLLPPGDALLPWPARASTPPAFLSRGDAPSPEVAAFAERLAKSAPGITGFLADLTSELYAVMTVDEREFGDPWPPGQTFTARHGSCRDLAVLFVDACRAVGIPSRFVSGYQEGDRDQDSRELHAWAEAFIPGGGWRGYDPTHGLAVADRHIAVAAAAHPRDAAPVTGTYRGRASQSLSHHIELAVLP